MQQITIPFLIRAQTITFQETLVQHFLSKVLLVDFTHITHLIFRITCETILQIINRFNDPPKTYVTELQSLDVSFASSNQEPVFSSPPCICSMEHRTTESVQVIFPHHRFLIQIIVIQFPAEIYIYVFFFFFEKISCIKQELKF